MARTFSTDLLFDQPVAELLALFTQAAFLEKEALIHGQSRATCTELQRSEGWLELRIDQAGPARIPGKRHKEVRSAVTYEWDLGAPSCRWQRRSEGEKGIHVSGTHQLMATPEGGTRYRMTWELEIRVPVVGRVLEKKAEPAILEGARKRAAFARRWLERQNP